jgi:hypothetical protein
VDVIINWLYRVGYVVPLGMAGFAAGALREKEALRRLQVLDK